jgi:alpha/beta superfamily hydrolase
VTNGIKAFFIDGPAGKLEALLNEGQPGAAYAALVCHPHPLHGGTMHNKVVYHAMKALSSFGFPALRFNFRGAGLSEGTHDHGQGEVEDVRAALDWLNSQYHLAIIFCGFSFGAATGLRAACADSRVAGIVSLGTPVAAEDRVYGYKFLENCSQPKLFISGSHDQFGSKANLKQLFAIPPEPKQLVLIEGADHFFQGHLPKVQAAMQDWVRKVLTTGK